MVKRRDTYTFEIDEWAAEVDRIIGLDRSNIGAGHRDEDRLLQNYVRDRAYEGDARAVELVRLLDAERRRWYA
jgi:hypothetical protein